MKVTNEMIGAAHDICLKKGDFVLSADLLSRIYLAMEERRDNDDKYFDGDTDDLLRNNIDQLQNEANDLAQQLSEKEIECEKLKFALENCRLLAARNRKQDWALLILGFCAEGGVAGSIYRKENNDVP